MTRIRGYKYRAYPNKKQQEFFEKTFGSCRFVYNYYLAMRRDVWNERHDTLSYKERHCSYPGCPNLTDGRYCPEHQQKVNSNYEKYGRDKSTKKRYGRAKT